jgi:transcriptional regulator with XRE-family HTH domain
MRKHRSVTLKDFSLRVGVTASLISQIERGVAAPLFSSPKKISEALGIPIASFFGQEQGNLLQNDFSPIVRKNERKILLPSPGVTYHLLTKNLQGKIEFLLALDIEMKGG